MDKSFNKMDFPSKHFAAYERRFPLLPPVETIGYILHKKQRMIQSFSGCNFSFVLSGTGDYVLRGKTYRVEAPCVLLQWPGEPMNYGPDPVWEEVYLIYPGEWLSRLVQSRIFLPGNPPVRPVRSVTALHSALERLNRECMNPDTNADRIDSLCWNVIVSSYGLPAGATGENEVFRTIGDFLEKHPLSGEIGIDRLARNVGMSESSLRRCWAKNDSSRTFRAYRDSVFVRESCRLLIETPLPIKEIAGKLGFPDVYYFSRKFRLKTGLPPSEYRKRHTSDLPQ